MKTRLEVLQDLKYEGQGSMVAGDEEDGTVNVGEWCELLNEGLARFDKFVRKLKDKFSIASGREDAETRWTEDLVQEERFKRRVKVEVKIEKMKMEMKFPKLKITKFEEVRDCSKEKEV